MCEQMKRYFYIIGSLAIVLLLFFIFYEGNGVKEKPKADISSRLVLKSDVDGLNIEIDKVSCGITVKDSEQSFALGDTGQNGTHKIILQKDINQTHEIYYEEEFGHSPYPKNITISNLKAILKNSVTKR
ncbi:MAG: hypothetical protein QG559_397 [Campylobacterota bacterium]|nr:hypothetical protein [Campylobacterota bacterium]